MAMPLQVILVHLVFCEYCVKDIFLQICMQEQLQASTVVNGSPDTYETASQLVKVSQVHMEDLPHFAYHLTFQSG